MSRIHRNKARLSLELPSEFIELCQTDNVSPEMVLRGFIADLCELINWHACPRKDGYSSNGSDERYKAREYYERVGYSWKYRDMP